MNVTRGLEGFVVGGKNALRGMLRNNCNKEVTRAFELKFRRYRRELAMGN